MEPFYPLRALVCEQCFLVQLEEYESPSSIFSDYAYFSSYSTVLARALPSATPPRWSSASASARTSHVVEIASNDGYLLQYFKERGVPVLGIEPAANVAEVAVAEGPSHARGVLRRRDGAQPRARLQRRPADRQQRARARPGHQRLRRRDEDAAQAGRRDHDGVPASDAADRREAVGHDLPRALLVPVVHAPRDGSSPRTACACSTSRSCRRTAARCGSSAATTTTPASPRPTAPTSCSRARTPPATRRSRPISTTASRWPRTSAGSSPR